MSGTEKLITFLTEIKSNLQKYQLYDEAKIRNSVVERILNLLGWDTFNVEEVNPEYSVGGKRVDYSLRLLNTNKVFIEAKRASEDLDNTSHKEQLLNYSFQEGVKLAILTNGLSWWFYLPFLENSRWEQRKFYSIDIAGQEPESMANKFIIFLSKDNVDNGEALIRAEQTHKGKQKEKIIEKTLPKAWNKIIEEADSIIYDLINENVEKICGLPVDDIEIIERFLSEHKQQFLLDETPRTSPKNHIVSYINRKPLPSLSQGSDITRKKPSAFFFNGTNYPANNNIDILRNLSEILYSTHGGEFELTLQLKGRKRKYFSKDKYELKVPFQIASSNYYVETNLNAPLIHEICFNLVTLFNYKKTDFKIIFP